MSPFVRQAKFRKAFSRTALGSEISRKEGDWAWIFMKVPGGRSVDLIWRRSPGSRWRVWSIFLATKSDISWLPDVGSEVVMGFNDVPNRADRSFPPLL